ncbi:RNA polymerase sigma factor SigJ [Conexibacter sp. JD483]|uniref:RNA polymerase sigma factor SigJ n=1 Tax=unclassified Conexibacter TaxID=2627773 RepID=UPI002716FD64|nr:MULTISPECIES: RNA polymerase sigma factor SigJ [unclassified Conexibacter]MDO8188393.1 RNA polymerase sigma factor SigJ [Conexibacter sp. CPCC 205706]MDO8198180.1 RNA polymerase sigma factor SigJ [Conexibacter sp. CPCC 205762]MDR9370684.1 RNA polymerase sigma factor SigJ [Conexibacter sp. JD483]
METNERLRRLAFEVGYRMLGSAAEADDVAQETLLRLHSAAAADNDEAFATTVATRLSIDVLRSARVRREQYVGEWLPEPLVELAAAPAVAAASPPDPAARVEADETISLAFLALLERLSPEERAVLVLREAFGYGYDEIGAVLDKGEPACRQLLSRARRRVDAERPRFDADAERRDALAARFLDAARGGDLDGLVALLADDVVLVGDGGGKARALPRPFVGVAAVGKALAAFVRIGVEQRVTFTAATVNGQPGLLIHDADGALAAVMGLDVADGRIARVNSVVNPDKLARLGTRSTLALRPSARRGG